MCLSSDVTKGAGRFDTKCLSEDEAPPRAAHPPPSSKFLTSSTAFLPLGSSILQLYRTRFASFPAVFTRLPVVTDWPELLLPASTRVLTRPTFKKDHISRCATHPSKNPSSAQRARITSGSEEPMFTAFAALLMLRSAGCCSCIGFHQMRAHLQGFPPRGGPNPRTSIAECDLEFSSSMGFWFPSKTFFRLPLNLSQPVSDSIPPLVSQRAVSVRWSAYPIAND